MKTITLPDGRVIEDRGTHVEIYLSRNGLYSFDNTGDLKLVCVVSVPFPWSPKIVSRRIRLVNTYGHSMSAFEVIKEAWNFRFGFYLIEEIKVG